MNDQENIRQMKEKELNVKRREWDKIRLEMEAGSSDTIRKAKFVEDWSSMALILKELKEELKSQSDTLRGYEKALSCSEMLLARDEGEWITQGWCEALEFSIKLIA